MTMTAGTAANESLIRNQNIVENCMSASEISTGKERGGSRGMAPHWGQLAAESLTLALHS